MKKRQRKKNNKKLLSLLSFRVLKAQVEIRLPLLERNSNFIWGGIVPPNQGKPIVNEAIGEMKFTPKNGKVIIKMGGEELTQ